MGVTAGAALTCMPLPTSLAFVNRALILMLLPFASAAAAPSQGGPAVPEPTIPPARDGNIAIAEELCAARKAATIEAYDLFIARHPDHPLAEKARAERARIATRRP